MTRTGIALLLTLSAAAVGSTIGACSTTSRSTASGPAPGADASPDAATFVPDPPAVYVAKVKNILVGLAPTDEEVATVVNDPTQLGTLIDGWMKLPEYQVKMLRFFELAFQQTQVSIDDYVDQTYGGQTGRFAGGAQLLVQNLSESFARTALSLASQGQPFTNAMTTQSLMMTPAIMQFYAYLDSNQVDSENNVTDRFPTENPNIQTIYVEAAQGPIPLSETLDPNSPNYMHWYDPDVTLAGAADGSACEIDPITYPANGNHMQTIMLGGLDSYKVKGQTCNNYNGNSSQQIVASDYTTWNMVTIRAPKTGEQPTAFFDMGTLRTTNELVLQVPRVGFFSTPAFFANWQTNQSNTMRVTTNQALLVALGQGVDGTDSTSPSTTPGLDQAHMANPTCVGCHQLLDPTRSILAQTWSWDYHNQTADDGADGGFFNQKGQFAFEQAIKPVNSINDFGAELAAHPLFAQAWVQKLCYYANSEACDNGGFTVPPNPSKDDSEFDRVVRVFQNANYDWNTLVKTLLSSPLTTHAAPTKTADDNGEVIAVSRRDHICAAWNARFGFTDICGLNALEPRQTKATIPQIAAGLPSDGYGRGSAAPVLPNQSTLFFRAGTENICVQMAPYLIDPSSKYQIQGVQTWSSTQPQAAIGDFVQLVAGLPPSDPRAADLQSALEAHYQQAVQGGWTGSDGTKQPAASPTNALQSTFVVACLAPSSVSIGL